MAVSAFDAGGFAWAVGNDISGPMGGTSVTGWTGGEVAAFSEPGTGFGVGAMASLALTVEPACGEPACGDPACSELASGAGKASEGMAVMFAGGSVLGDIEACDGLGFG